MKICQKCRHPFNVLCVECLAKEHFMTLKLQGEAMERRAELDRRYQLELRVPMFAFPGVLSRMPWVPTP